MSTQPVGHTHSQAKALSLDQATLSGLEQTLIESLKDPALQWRSSRTQAREVWESDRGIDTMRLGFQTGTAWAMSNNGDYPSRGQGGLFGYRPHVHLDWHSTESETLVSTTELHEVILSKTHVNSYSHRTRTGVDKTWYSAEFRSLQDKGDVKRIDGSTCPSLATLFLDISKRVQ